ncbi:DNA translocase FtsK [Prevotella stercorea]|uniref:FtsK/SpoIIIE family DNA translocase n=1 Tax=Leyella stercorea TaxID=363265 RepID=UPI001F2FD43D|nr:MULTISPECIES: DNA translocase FtsK [Prevotellaceae]MCF2644155.1 DNA translocase FtsK [Leyella stercorea]MDY3968649.1 DNA translocase FtsK [Prevotella sp.]MDY4645616.1 DNA translocase FtsK [Prevotella sp.]
MAKKKAERKPANIKEALGLSSFLRSERTDFLLGLIIILFAIYLFVAMSSFLTTGAADQSILESMRPGEWFNTERIFQNYCSSVGAMLSYFFMTENFGFAAFMIPSFLVLAGVRLMRICMVNMWKWFFGMAIAMYWLSVFLAKVVAPFTGELTFNPGGRHGALCVEYAENVIGPPGLAAILFFTAIALLTFISTQTITCFRRMLNPLAKGTANAGRAVSSAVSSIVEKTGKDGETDQADADYDDEEPVDNITGKTVAADNNDNIGKNGNKDNNGKNAGKGDDEPELTSVIDLTDMSGAQPDTKPAKSAAKLSDNNIKGNPDGADSQLTVEVGKEDKANGNISTQNHDIDTPINPLEPFTRYRYPGLDLLNKDSNDGKPYVDMEEVKAHNEEIVKVLKSFGIDIREIKATVGPTITLYEITPAEGIRITKIRNLEDDIALRLSALGVRIIAPIPGKGTIGIEVPNKKRHNVSMESILNSRKFQETKFDLPIALGKTITNEVFMADLTKIPHLLVAGATGQGKSVGLNVIITSLLYKKHPNELKLVLIDPKKVEFSVYAPIADHFMAQVDDDDEPIITDVTKVVRTLKSLCTLMDHRYDLLKLAGARNIKEYNDKYLRHKLNPEHGHEFMPYIVVIIDEFGDLIMTAGKEVEMPIARIAQLARAVGIHMIIATQRPTTSIITGNIKANFPGRIAFKVSSMMDSRIILDRPGANQLIGMGDMLYLNGNEPTRVQCAFINTPEIIQINEYIAKQSGPTSPMQLPEPKNDEAGDGASGSSSDIGAIDPLFEEAARSVIISQQGSTSMIQRRFSIGYNRAGRLMDQLEKAGIVGAAHGGKPRDVLIADENQLDNIIGQLKRM